MVRGGVDVPSPSGVSRVRCTRRYAGCSAAFRECGRCLLLLAVVALVHCGSPTRRTDSPDFVFAGTVTAGNQPFHNFTTPRDGDLTVSIAWAIPQANQTVCAGRSDIADLPAKCAPAVGGRTNAVTFSVRAGDRYVVYVVPDRSADAAYTIEGKIR